MPYDWKKHLKHQRDDRDALVACGNPAPSRPDPDGGLIEVKPRIFHGKIYNDFMRERGHTTVDFYKCECSR
jgi:hypothetical protein